MNKKTIITILLALVWVTGQAQTTVKGRVVNERGHVISYIQTKIKMGLPGSTNFLYTNKTYRFSYKNAIYAHKISTIKNLLPK